MSALSYMQRRASGTYEFRKRLGQGQQETQRENCQ